MISAILKEKKTNWGNTNTRHHYTRKVENNVNYQRDYKYRGKELSVSSFYVLITADVVNFVDCRYLIVIIKKNLRRKGIHLMNIFVLENYSLCRILVLFVDIHNSILSSLIDVCLDGPNGGPRGCAESQSLARETVRLWLHFWWWSFSGTS